MFCCRIEVSFPRRPRHIRLKPNSALCGLCVPSRQIFLGLRRPKKQKARETLPRLLLSLPLTTKSLRAHARTTGRSDTREPLWSPRVPAAGYEDHGAELTTPGPKNGSAKTPEFRWGNRLRLFRRGADGAACILPALPGRATFFRSSSLREQRDRDTAPPPRNQFPTAATPLTALAYFTL